MLELMLHHLATLHNSLKKCEIVGGNDGGGERGSLYSISTSFTNHYFPSTSISDHHLPPSHDRMEEEEEVEEEKVLKNPFHTLLSSSSSPIEMVREKLENQKRISLIPTFQQLLKQTFISK